jgi:hypothetical protein
MMPENEILSDVGRRRREEIQRLAKRHARWRQRNRRLRGAGIVLGCLLLVVTWRAAKRADLPQSGIPPMVMRPASTVLIERIATDPQIAARLSTGNVPPRWSFIDDDAFLQSMADAGHRSGLMRLNGRLLVLPR